MLLPPRSLYTSVISNLSLKPISQPLLPTSPPKLYLSNLITQPPHTHNYHLKHHIHPLTLQLPQPFIHFLISTSQSYTKHLLQPYQQKNSKPLPLHKQQLKHTPITLLTPSNLLQIS
ncbi:2-phospho-L-lactate transferase CofD family protein, partial [Staphylococcus epidermidis]|uniref:2-phospho-L-lactate transferase CofD family protein n=1 Tax=Staphylococcus epidermidis TaxID=1282 RepID=UPI0037D9C8C0